MPKDLDKNHMKKLLVIWQGKKSSIDSQANQE